MADKNFSDDENDILNQSYEDIYSIKENKNAIEKLDLGAASAYRECGKQSRIKVALDKNGNKIGIARSPINSKNESITRNCLNYAFLASCGERVPHILRKFKDNDDSSSFEVQKFFPHDAMHNYFQLDVGEISFLLLNPILKKTNIKSFEDVAQLKDKNVKIKSDDHCTYTYFKSYFLVYHILTECDQEFKTQFIDHFATLFADELCFRILDRNRANMLVVPSKDGHKKDIVNIDVDFDLQEKVTEIAYSTYLALYLVVKELTFSFDESYTNDELSKLNNFLNQKYSANGDKVNFKFRPKQELKISPEIIAEIDKKIIEKIKQRLNFRKDKFVQYYIDNCIRRGDIDKPVAFSDFQTFMKSLYQYLKKYAELLKTNKDFGHFYGPFNDFMEKNKDYQSFNNLSVGNFNKKWDERAEVLKNPKKMEEKKVNKGKIKGKNSSILFDNNNIFKKLKEEAIGDPNSIFYKENQKKNENEIINNDKKYEKEKIINDNKIENSIIKDKSNQSEKELKNIEEQKVNSQVYPSYPASEQISTTIKAPIINSNNNDQKKFENEDKSKIKNENEDGTKDNNKTNRTYLMKWLLIILGVLLIGGGIALFLTASALALKFLAIGLGILGAVGFGIGLFYNKIGDYYRAKPGSCCISFLTYIILEPKEKNKENNINLEEGKNNLIDKDENVL